MEELRFGSGAAPPAAWLAEMDRISAVTTQLARPLYLALSPLSAYAAYVDWMVDRFQPRFLALSIEVNTYTAACSD